MTACGKLIASNPSQAHRQLIFPPRELRCLRPDKPEAQKTTRNRHGKCKTTRTRIRCLALSWQCEISGGGDRSYTYSIGLYHGDPITKLGPTCIDMDHHVWSVMHGSPCMVHHRVPCRKPIVYTAAIKICER